VNDRGHLQARAWSALAVLAIVIGLLLFICAGTVRYWQAWMYLAVFVGGSAFTTRYLLRHDPALLARRMRGGPTAERRPAQRIIMLVMSFGFMMLIVVSALDRRYGWSDVPPWVVVAGDLLVAIGVYCTFLVYRENSFSSAIIEVAAGQRVVTTGPYAIVRHPMYASAFLYLVGTPLALGSYRGLVAIAMIVPFLVWRLVDEERLLLAQLPGYAEYRDRVRCRLVPFVW
jgi:protein-S-isoprenylcysteine O-methyltransferase Ste14